MAGKKKQPVKDFQKVKYKVGKLKPGAANATDTKVTSKRLKIKESQFYEEDDDLVFEDEITQLRGRVKQLSVKSRHYSAVMRKEAYTGLIKIFRDETSEEQVQSFLSLVVESLAKGFIDEEDQVRSLVLSLGVVLMKRVPDTMLSSFLPHWIQFVLLSLTHIEPVIKRDGLLFLASSIDIKPTLMVKYLVKIITTLLPGLSPKSSRPLKKNGPSETDIIIQILALYLKTVSKKENSLLYEYTWNEPHKGSLMIVRRPPETSGLEPIDLNLMQRIIEKLFTALSDAWIELADNIGQSRKPLAIREKIILVVRLCEALDLGSVDFFWSSLPKSMQNLLGKNGKQRLIEYLA